MRVLDLFSGLGGWSAPFIAAGHEVWRAEIETKLPAEWHGDILELRAEQVPWRPDLILASPPCEGFSVMNIGRNWHGPGCLVACGTHVDMAPKTDKARLALDLVAATLRLVEELQPTFWLMENPRDKLRVLPIVDGLERRTVTYCHYGEKRMKPTDLWSSRWPRSLVLAPTCNNGDPCHVRAPRGSRTGTQGFGDYWQKSVVPYQLADAVRVAVELDLGRPHELARPPAEHPQLALALA